MAPTGPLAPIVWRKRPQCGFPLRVAVSKTVNGALLRVILRYCESVGADDQISKPEVTQLARRAMVLIKAREEEARAKAAMA